MSCLQTTEYVCGPFKIRPSGPMAAGTVVEGHAHNFDHDTIVFSGSIRVRARLPDGSEREVVKGAGTELLIRAGVTHQITALRDGTLYKCYYVHRHEDGSVSEEYTGWEEAYR